MRIFRNGGPSNCPKQATPNRHSSRHENRTMNHSTPAIARPRPTSISYRESYSNHIFLAHRNYSSQQNSTLEENYMKMKEEASRLKSYCQKKPEFYISETGYQPPAQKRTIKIEPEAVEKALEKSVYNLLRSSYG